MRTHGGSERACFPAARAALRLRALLQPHGTTVGSIVPFMLSGSFIARDFIIMSIRPPPLFIFSPQVNANSWQDPRSRGDEWTTCESDRPVLCQFASHDPEVLVKVVKEVQRECDGVDLNLGCPQGIARRGRYGSWLQDEWQLIYDMVSSVAQQCSVPITVKIRVFDDHDRTLQV